jgi:hypothetical protein
MVDDMRERWFHRVFMSMAPCDPPEAARPAPTRRSPWAAVAVDGADRDHPQCSTAEHRAAGRAGLRARRDEHAFRHTGGHVHDDSVRPGEVMRDAGMRRFPSGLPAPGGVPSTVRPRARLRVRLACAPLLALSAMLGAAATPATAAGEPVTPAEARSIAEEGFVYGLPRVMDYAVMHDFVINRDSGAWKAPFNRLHNEARVFTSADTTVVTPNSDTPYSIVWADLRAEPIVISVPQVDAGRYYSVMLVDNHTFNYGIFGTRTTGNRAGHFMIAGPRWRGETPPGIRKVFRSGTDFSLLLFRTQLFGPQDLPKVRKVQDGYRARTLSAFTGGPAPAAAPKIDWPAIDREQTMTRFFEYLDLVLDFAPPAPEEKAIRAKLARIGVGTKGRYDPAALSPEVRAAIAEGTKAGNARVDARVGTLGTEINGWRVASTFGNRAFFNGDWLLRAAAARAGIYGLDAEEAMYPMTRKAADGSPLDGSKHGYTITFPKGQLPPVNAFWSVTMYDGRTQFLVANPLDRYLVNSTMLGGMKRGADGSLTIHVRKDSPGKDLESNWLPAPDGPMMLAMRLYWPKTEPPSILPPGKGTWSPPKVVVAD